MSQQQNSKKMDLQFDLLSFLSGNSALDRYTLIEILKYVYARATVSPQEDGNKTIAIGISKMAVHLNGETSNLEFDLVALLNSNTGISQYTSIDLLKYCFAKATVAPHLADNKAIITGITKLSKHINGEKIVVSRPQQAHYNSNFQNYNGRGGFAGGGRGSFAGGRGGRHQTPTRNCDGESTTTTSTGGGRGGRGGRPSTPTRGRGGRGGHHGN
jgi:hypothetical protein